MKHDEAWNEWMNRNREHPPPSDLTERIVVALESSRAQAVDAAAIPLQSRTLAQRIVPYLLLSAALLLFGARLYTTVGLLIPEFAFAAQPDHREQGLNHVELVATGS